ncbi:50S ribosomal protein L1 [Entomospira culicis]|uniref:Large ribosomal subunit protein uL1 n=1 Tax=Entomospira culicis TaxID=2719989 RepID=A0A968KVC1_9SPIO|nr:50S ribosomal protein L1 [Entomospira culicis]NIZ19796.1 50S ribosomal protein L1 [Entomospira culicis]NIZ70010.1 50S ribosomal protein L1 [Entomospira culicis]WDI37115.1 50S ribosomal protein L1 [Entomospira culicis]WDI38744.1 50S ribosomal protein L1 [Entomospira culicis]
MRRGKKYLEAKKAIEADKIYEPMAALELIKKIAFAKFDETVEVSVALNIKKSHSIRDTFVLPHQFTAEKKILVFAKGEKADEARAAGAAYVGDDDLIQKVKDGWTDFDVCIATPDMMKDVGKLGPALGRRGLMPNPRTKTVTNDITATVAELKKGRIEFRADKTGVVHLAVGKLSMPLEHVQENLMVFFSELIQKRPTDLKGEFIRSVYLASTMGPAIKLENAVITATRSA